MIDTVAVKRETLERLTAWLDSVWGAEVEDGIAQLSAQLQAALAAPVVEVLYVRAQPHRRNEHGNIVAWITKTNPNLRLTFTDNQLTSAETLCKPEQP